MWVLYCIYFMHISWCQALQVISDFLSLTKIPSFVDIKTLPTGHIALLGLRHSILKEACWKKRKGKWLRNKREKQLKQSRVRLDWAYFCWNWKHCSEIIFKCVNSAVRPIFNEKSAEKCNLWDLWIVHGCTVHIWLINHCGLNKKKKKKKKEKNAEQKCKCHNHLNPNGYLIKKQRSKWRGMYLWTPNGRL